jgi:hypothetical protein
MENIGRWVVNGVIGLIGIFGLFIASRAVDGVFYGMGLALVAGAVAFIFYSIRKTYDEAGYRPRGPGDTETLH